LRHGFSVYEGKRTISGIIAETTTAIWSTLQPPFMPSPNEAKWKRIAERYLDLWNFPNCIGSTDGKHVRIKCFPKSGSLYFNYKDYILVVLVACANSNAVFKTVHVGDFGKNSDGSEFRASTLGQMLEKEELHIPLPMDGSGEIFPYYFVADEALPLKINLMRPYPRRMLNKQKNFFNYRLSCARKSVECAFGILNVRFKILEGPICRREETVNSVIKASVVHNFIRTQKGLFCEGGENFAVNKSSHHIVNEEDDGSQRLSRARLLLNRLADYFLTSAGAISSQWSYAT
jgi:hypothetical protein